MDSKVTGFQVGRIYLTRNGHEVKIIEVTNSEIVGLVNDKEKEYYDPLGNCYRSSLLDLVKMARKSENNIWMGENL